MNQIAILYPVFAQAFLTLVIGGLMAVARARALAGMDRQRGSPDLALGRVVWPEDAAKRAANYANQFELPVLFYAVAAFALITGGADFVMLVLAWAFVATRIVHAAIHVGPNKVRWRSPAFGVGFLIVLAMWVKLFLHIVSRGVAL
ncbi:MAG: MAPEG family protein [Hyphomonadaceae bacterium]|nr:MAPEG family protein [Hyphomonadaceae bacterium]